MKGYGYGGTTVILRVVTLLTNAGKKYIFALSKSSVFVERHSLRDLLVDNSFFIRGEKTV